jgi:phospholipid/cholesterol/gamma-HCH transport system substrate-binding protein
LEKIYLLKISNETKVGALTAIAITVLVLGFNALKGKSLFNKPKKIFALFDKTPGLANTAPVYYKGLQIGVTGDKVEKDAIVSQIIVPITLTKDVLLPKNSIAVISSNPLGIASSVIEIQPGNDTRNFIKPGDTLITNATADILAEVSKQINPVLFEVKNAVHSLDSVLMIIGNTFDPNTKSNFQGILGNVNKTTANLIKTSATLQELLSSQSGTLAKSFSNVAAFTDNLSKQNEKINGTLTNIQKVSSNVANLKLQEPLDNLNKTITELQQVISKFNNDKGTLGLLMKDPDLYNQMHSLTYSLNTLVDDLKVNPKRYISIFGRKDKKIKPLNKPISDTLTH